MNITALTERGNASLAERYRAGDPDTVALFGAHPQDGNAWSERAAWLDAHAHLRAERRAIAGAVRAYQAQLPRHPESAAALAKLERDDCLVVVGGQQAGLFGGAMLIYYKALTVIQAARDAERRLGRPVVPVFWIAGEDHDFEEANHVYVLPRSGGARRIRIERPAGPRAAVSRTALSRESWDAALRELAEQLPDSQYKPRLIAGLRAHAADAPSLSLAFARLLAEWFGKHGLVLLDADDPQLRKLEAPFFARLIGENERLEAALKSGEQAVLMKGYKLQAEAAYGCSNLFLHHEQGRLLLFREAQSGDYVDRRGTVRLSLAEMLELPPRAPDLLSTNALTRPLMQDYVLPVLAAVLGPSELAYWGILGPAFAAFGLAMPVLLPRQSYLYIDHNVQKLIDKYGLTLEQAVNETALNGARASWLDRQQQVKLDELFRGARERFAQLYDPVVAAVAAAQPDVAQLAEKNRELILEQIGFLEARAAGAQTRRHESSLRQWDRIRDALVPLGKPQERVYGTIHFWNLYGPDWLEAWLNVPYEVTGGQRSVAGLTPEEQPVCCGTD